MGEYSFAVETHLREILDSGRFNVDDCRERKFSFSHSLCLLWQDPDTGEVHGRLSDEIIHDAAVAASLLDLVVLGRIELELEKESFWTNYMLFSREIHVKVINDTPTDSYLDDILFDRIRKYKSNRSAGSWMANTYSVSGGSVLTPLLDSLVDKGIFTKESKTIGKKYPTLEPGPQKALSKEIQMIALHGHPADGFTWPLLRLARGVDSLTVGYAPVLQHQFDKKDYPQAKKAIETLIKVERKENKKKQAKRDDDSFDNLCEKDEEKATC